MQSWLADGAVDSAGSRAFFADAQGRLTPSLA